MSSETVSFGVKRGIRSFHVEGPKTEKAREAAMQSLVREIWRIRVPMQPLALFPVLTESIKAVP